MECFAHSLKTLFQQLGLASDREAIADFIENHTLSDTQDISTASFWTPSQQQFLREAYEEDADWVEQIDTLDTLLRL